MNRGQQGGDRRTDDVEARGPEARRNRDRGSVVGLGDDGEALGGYKWHGYAWGAECAWSGSATTPEDFNSRIGAVLFGELWARFGDATAFITAAGISLLGVLALDGGQDALTRDGLAIRSLARLWARKPLPKPARA